MSHPYESEQRPIAGSDSVDDIIAEAAAVIVEHAMAGYPAPYGHDCILGGWPDHNDSQELGDEILALLRTNNLPEFQAYLRRGVQARAEALCRDALTDDRLDALVGAYS